MLQRLKASQARGCFMGCGKGRCVVDQVAARVSDSSASLGDDSSDLSSLDMPGKRWLEAISG